MKLIIGLGNPEPKYLKNRHNTGYIFVDEIFKKKLPKDTIVKKTNCFMNDSGSIVKSLVDKFSIPLNNLYIVHDDLDIPLGEFKIQKGVGPKLHNGLYSINKKLGKEDYWRIRIGVDAREIKNRTPGIDYVLMDFSDQEEKILLETIDKAIKNLIFLIKNE